LKSLSETARTMIEELILSGELVVGTKVTERDLAEKLDMSRVPVREAIKDLLTVGLLGRVGTRGVIVRKLDTDEIKEIYAIRMILEARAARLASERITQQSLQTLQQLHQDMREAFKEEDYASYYGLNLKFHKEIHQAAHTPRLIEIIAMVMKESLLLHSRGLVDRENLQTSLAEHQNLLDALISRDSELAEIYMRRHIQSGLKRLHLDDESNESDELN
jgi:DNA-binding GntR family transcriptional regulator